MTITSSTSLISIERFSGLTSVADCVTLPDGRAVVLGKETSGAIGLQFHSSTGFLTKDIPLPIGSTAKDLTLLADNSLLVTFGVGTSTLIARYDLNGNLLSEPTVTDGTISNIIALDDGGFASFTGTSMRISSFFERTLVIENTVSLSAANGKVAVTRLDNGNIAVAYSLVNGAQTELVTAILKQDGTIVQSPTVKDTFGTINTEPAIVATRDGFAVAYISNRFTNTDVVLTYFDANGTQSGTTQQITTTAGTAEQTPAMARIGDNLLLAWMDNLFSDTDAVVRLLPDNPASFAVLGSASINANVNDVDNLTLTSLGPKTALSFVTNLTNNTVQVAQLDVFLNVNGDAASDIYVATSQVENIFLGSGIDTLSYASSTAGVLAFLDSRPGRGGFAENDVVSVVENLIGSDFADRLVGNSGGNSLNGGLGNDTLEGAAGADTIIGGAGRDVMKGGADADVFVFVAKTDSGFGAQSDRIKDFGGSDVIDLSAMDANARQAGNQAFIFGGVTPGANRVWFALNADGDTVIRGDLDGNKRVDFEIKLADSHVLTAADFIL